MPDWEDYDSGPFCRHFSDPDECDLVCAECGHGCAKTDNSHELNGPCNVDGCPCTGWTDAV